jgi:seryl-tRNA synthetase
MLDPKFIKENIDLVRDGIKKKKSKVNLDRFLELDELKRKLQQEFEEKRAEQNKISKEISQAQAEEREKLIAEVSILKKEIQEIEEKMKPILEE